MKRTQVESIVSIILSALVICLHILGIFLLWKTKHMKKDMTILSISLTNIIFSVYCIMCFGMNNEMMCKYSTIIVSGVIIPFHVSLILLTLERFFEVYFHMTYHLSCFYRYRVHMCVTVWILWPVMSSIVTLATMYEKYERIKTYIFSYFDTFGQITVAICFFSVYTYLYIKFRTTLGGQAVIRHKKLFMPFFIVLTFTIFEVIPGILVSAKELHSEVIIWYLYSVDMLSNALLYIFIQPNVRELLKRKCKRRWRIRKSIFTHIPLSAHDGKSTPV